MISFLLISNKSIDIVSLYLSFHTMHFLQFFNVKYFESLSKIYKQQLKIRNQISERYLNKVNYLKFLKKTKKQSMTQTTIMFAWIVTDEKWLLFMCKLLITLNLYFFALQRVINKLSQNFNLKSSFFDVIFISVIFFNRIFWKNIY